MGSSNRRILKTITIFHIALVFCYQQPRCANAIPTAEDINGLAEKGRQTINTFMQKSFQLRMAYEYSGKFLTRRDKEELETLAKMAGEQLLAITESQRNIKQQIEDYQGDDWDQRYGATGLWRKLSAELYITNEYKCGIDFYLALTAPQPQRNVTLQKILTQLDSLNTVYISAESQLLRAKIYSLLSPTEPNYKKLAQEDFDSLCERSDMKHSTVFKTAIERIKLFGPAASDQLKTLAEDIAKSKCKDDIELVLSLALIQRKYEPESLRKTLQTRPQIEDFFGSLILSDLSHRIDDQQHTIQYFQRISVFEAELASQAAWKNKTKEYKILLTCLSGTEKFQTPLILYITAIALADSSPAEAVNLLIKASTLQSAVGGRKSNRLNIEAHDIAGQAAQLAYSSYSNDIANCQLAVEAFENYYTMADEKIDEKLEYLYAVVLSNCGQVEKSKILLDKIANRPAGRWRNRAKLDLITTAIRQHQSGNPEKISVILQQLDGFITDLRRREEDDKLRTEAINIYCRLLFDSKQIASAPKVLDILGKTEIEADPNLNVYKSKALRQLGKLDEAAVCLCEIAGSNINKYTEAMELLSEFIDKIEYYQAMFEDFSKITKDCYTLACYCWDYGRTEDSRRAALILAEISTFITEKDKSKSSAACELVDSWIQKGDTNDIDLLRCRARLLTAQGKSAKAARLWAQLANMQKIKSRQKNQQSWKWWRAKFYELDCFSKMPQTDNRGILHTIEVLENTYTDIPPLWAEKLNLLKIHCR